MFSDETPVNVIYDYNMVPDKERPQIIIQVAAHVCAAAYYYRRQELDDDPFDSTARVYGVCLHPLYGGWFAMRAVFIFPEVQVAHLEYHKSTKQLRSNTDIVNVLRRFNHNWQDNSYRDVVPVIERYSELQRLYFNTKPADRFALVERWMGSENRLD